MPRVEERHVTSVRRELYDESVRLGRLKARRYEPPFPCMKECHVNEELCARLACRRLGYSMPGQEPGLGYCSKECHELDVAYRDKVLCRSCWTYETQGASAMRCGHASMCGHCLVRRKGCPSCVATSTALPSIAALTSPSAGTTSPTNGARPTPKPLHVHARVFSPQPTKPGLLDVSRLGPHSAPPRTSPLLGRVIGVGLTTSA
jgi:hypothetical protein